MAVFELNSRKWRHDDGGQLKENLIKAASKILNPIGSKHDNFWHTVDILGAPSHVTNAIRDIGNRLASYPAIIADAVYNHYADNQNWTDALQEAETNHSTLASLFQVHPIENNENNYSQEELAQMYELTRPRKGKKEGSINAQDYRNINSKKGEGNKYAATSTMDNFFDPNKVLEWSVGGMSGLPDENGLPISFDRFAYDIADTYGVYGNPNTWNNPVKLLRFAVGIIGSKGYPNRKDSKTSIVTKVPVAAQKAAYDKLNNQYGLGSLLANGTRVIKRFFGLEKDNTPIIQKTPTEEIVIEQQPNVGLDYNELRNRQAYAESRYKSLPEVTVTPKYKDGDITPYSNYFDAKDSPSNMIARTNLAIRMGLRKLQDKGLNPFGSGISNCTLTATQWIDPNNPVMHSVNIINNPAKYGYIPITPEDAIAGDLIISATPKRDSFHSMYIEGFDNSGQPIVRYSRGSGNPEDIVRGITLDEYNTRDKGKHSDTLYYRYAQNGYPLSELLVTPNGKSTGGPLYPFSFSKIPYIKTPAVRYEGGSSLNLGVADNTRVKQPLLIQEVPLSSEYQEAQNYANMLQSQGFLSPDYGNNYFAANTYYQKYTTPEQKAVHQQATEEKKAKDAERALNVSEVLFPSTWWNDITTWTGNENLNITNPNAKFAFDLITPFGASLLSNGFKDIASTISRKALFNKLRHPIKINGTIVKSRPLSGLDVKLITPENAAIITPE